MQILFINNDGGGFADYITVEAHTTVEKLFASKLPERDAEDYLIRVNRQPVPSDYLLQDGDRVSMTPTKISGATPVTPGSFRNPVNLEPPTAPRRAA